MYLAPVAAALATRNFFFRAGFVAYARRRAMEIRQGAISGWNLSPEKWETMADVVESYRAHP